MGKSRFEEPAISIDVEHIDHMGIIAAIVKKYKLVKIIDKLIPKESNNQGISHGQAILALLYMGYGISGKALYLVQEFFRESSISDLFGPDITLKDLTDDALLSALDAIFKYGVMNFFQDVAFKILVDHNLLGKFAYMDTTSHSFNRKKKRNNGSINITHGHSKNHRDDLPQLVQLLVTTNNALPFWHEAHSGNKNDRVIFQDALIKMEKYLSLIAPDHRFTYVADSSLYSKKFLLNDKIDGMWITRIPETIREAKRILWYHSNSAQEWTIIDKDYKFREYSSNYGGHKQRWILVRCRKSKYKEIKTFQKKLDNEEILIRKNIKALNKRIYTSKEDVKFEIRKLREYHPFFTFHYELTGIYDTEVITRNSRRIGFSLDLSYSRNQEKINCKMNTKGKFILATNNLNTAKLSSVEVINAYRKKNGQIEGCFRLMKDSTFKMAKSFLTRVDRIEAMMAIVSFTVFIYNLGQKLLREELEKKNKTVPNQQGQQISNPTLKWAMQLLSQIVKVIVKVDGRTYTVVKGIGTTEKTIINCFGKSARNIYGFA